MNVIDIINRKKQGFALTEEEINYFIKGILSGEIADYQASSLLMAICLKGLDFDETLYLTRAMRDSGDKADLSIFNSLTIDKHSTGGVGDSTTFIILPILSALGYKSIKMSGKGLGHTGGTIDKLDSIKGFSSSKSVSQLKEQIDKVGFCIIGQTLDMCPADKYLYALRDVTGTVDSIPLIASSIMSKKLASNCDVIMLDIKVGDGAFMKNFADALALAELMCAIGRREGKITLAMITDMNQPLSTYIGNGLEIQGAIAVLQGEKSRLRDLSVAIASNILMEIENIDYATAFSKVTDIIDSKKAYQKFASMVTSQGGDLTSIATAKYTTEIKADKRGSISKINTEKLGSLVCDLGGGRRKKGDAIDYGVGVKNHVVVSTSVEIGDLLCTVYSNEPLVDEKIALFRDLFEIDNVSLDKPRLIYAKIDKNGEIMLY